MKRAGCCNAKNPALKGLDIGKKLLEVFFIVPFQLLQSFPEKLSALMGFLN